MEPCFFVTNIQFLVEVFLFLLTHTIPVRCPESSHDIVTWRTEESADDALKIS